MGLCDLELADFVEGEGLIHGDLLLICDAHILATVSEADSLYVFHIVLTEELSALSMQDVEHFYAVNKTHCYYVSTWVQGT